MRLHHRYVNKNFRNGKVLAHEVPKNALYASLQNNYVRFRRMLIPKNAPPKIAQGSERSPWACSRPHSQFTEIADTSWPSPESTRSDEPDEGFAIGGWGWPDPEPPAARRLDARRVVTVRKDRLTYGICASISQKGLRVTQPIQRQNHATDADQRGLTLSNFAL